MLQVSLGADGLSRWRSTVRRACARRGKLGIPARVRAAAQLGARGDRAAAPGADSDAWRRTGLARAGARASGMASIWVGGVVALLRRNTARPDASKRTRPAGTRRRPRGDPGLSPHWLRKVSAAVTRTKRPPGFLPGRHRVAARALARTVLDPDRPCRVIRWK